MTPSTHDEYLTHLTMRLQNAQDDPDMMRSLTTYTYEFVTLVDLSLDAQRDDLAALYCPTGQGAPRDPCVMLRSWLLMTLVQEDSSPDAWALRLVREPVLAILAGCAPNDTPGATTHRDFMTRYADGPYARRTTQDVPLSETLKGRHDRRLHDTTTARQADARRDHTTQSDSLCRRLLDQANTPRDPNTLQTRVENLCGDLGLTPSIAAGLFGDGTGLTVSGDGSPIETAASPNGQPTCSCPPHSKDCDHPRSFTSGTAQWCYHVHRGWVFGDEFYTISLHLNGHDVPLLTYMGIGNESDFTLSLKALDDLLKQCLEQHLPLDIATFIGDGHHDALPIYQYLKAKGIFAVIPLRAPDQTNDAPDDLPASATTHPSFDGYDDVTFACDGTPLCPGGCRMRHHHYVPGKDAHFYNCPAMRPNGTGAFIFHPDDCPNHQNCCPTPGKKMGHTLYLSSRTNPRYFPEIPRDTTRFKTLYAQRSGVERSNATDDSYHVDRRSRHAPYLLVRMGLVTCAKHAKLRWLDRQKHASKAKIFQETLDRLLHGEHSTELPN